MSFFDLDKKKLKCEFEKLQEKYRNFQSKNLSLDMSRGKPSPEQLDLSNDLLKNIDNDFESYGFDIRNYGCLEGISGARKLLSELLGCSSDNVIVGGNSSLSLMHDVITNFFVRGSLGCVPWGAQKIKFLCPCPGYDRHFQLCEFFNIEMIPIQLNNDGPDMVQIKNLVKSDKSIKGIWCVPKYSNPDGIVYSDTVIKELANLDPAAKDFKILWDNAYCVHDLYDEISIANIFEECEKSGNENFIVAFCSTSKITFAAGGISAIGCLGENFKDLKFYFSRKIVSFDKINQYRHVKFLKNLENVKVHMTKHANILRPKFNLILSKFNENFNDRKLLKWTEPKGGYFISAYTFGSAKRVEKLCKNAGLIITTVGAAYPHGIDPDDSHIRIAPSFPNIDQLNKAIDLFCLCVKISAIEKIMSKN